MDKRFEIRVVTKPTGAMELWLSTAPDTQWAIVGESNHVSEIVRLFGALMDASDKVVHRSGFARNEEYYNSIRDTLEDGRWYLINEQRIVAHGDKRECIRIIVDTGSTDHMLVCKGYEKQSFEV